MGMTAELVLAFERQSDATAFRCLRQEPPWKIVRGFVLEDGESLVHLNNISGGVFGGDALKLTAHLLAGAEVQVTTTGATRLYRPRQDACDASLISSFRLERGAMLQYLPDPLIPFRGSRTIQKNFYSLEDGATLFCWETVAPGRTAAGEVFAYERLRLATEVRVQGRPIYNDRLLLEPSRRSMHSSARFGAAKYLVTFLAVRAGSSAEEMRALEQVLESVVYGREFQGEPAQEGAKSSTLWGVTTLPAHGVLVRGMLDSAVAIPAMLQTLWSEAKRHLCGRVAIAPRKTY